MDDLGDIDPSDKDAVIRKLLDVVRELKVEKFELVSEMEKEEESMTNKLSKKIAELEKELEDKSGLEEKVDALETELVSYKKRISGFVIYLTYSLNDTMFILQEKIKQQKDQIQEMKIMSVREEQDREFSMERAYNDMMTGKGANVRLARVNSLSNGRNLSSSLPRRMGHEKPAKGVFCSPVMVGSMPEGVGGQASPLMTALEMNQKSLLVTPKKSRAIPMTSSVSAETANMSPVFEIGLGGRPKSLEDGDKKHNPLQPVSLFDLDSKEGKERLRASIGGVSPSRKFRY